MYATISPAYPGFDFENVSPDFDLGRLAKFREATIASLIPYGIIERDFETTYEQATEKRLNEIAEMI